MHLGKRRMSSPDPMHTPSKRRRLDFVVESTGSHVLPASERHDLLSRLSDELVLRILSFLSLPQLLRASLICLRFYRLSSDSQIWRQLYYMRFVLPRALRIPGFQPSLYHTSGVCSQTVMRHGGSDLRKSRSRGDGVDWKQQYKLRHNWAVGKCAVEELDVGNHIEVRTSRDTLVKLVEGIAVTVDPTSMLRIWDLKTKKILSQAILADAGILATPTCLAVDDCLVPSGRLEIALGFLDGSFAIWIFMVNDGVLAHQYTHSPDHEGQKVTQIAYSFPYLMAATDNAAIFLFCFEGGENQGPSATQGPVGNSSPIGDGKEGAKDQIASSEDSITGELEKSIQDSHSFLPPHRLTALKSHSSQPPLALSLRRVAGSVVASIAFVSRSRNSWSVGIQELHVRYTQSRSKPTPEVFSSRLYYASPMAAAHKRHYPAQGSIQLQPSADSQPDPDGGPTALCYTHPYLLATLPDNTLALYLCRSDATSISLSSGIRLWGHTSGIGDAEITSRGRAVSVSSRGDELRVWELEGRSGGKSVEIRSNPPRVPPTARDWQPSAGEWDSKRSWVGFDDEMVIVLKESGAGKETLVVYDFT